MTALARQWRRLVRFGFRLLYNEFAFTYDVVSVVVSLGQWRCWQRSALAHLPAPGAEPLLDLAHGTGNLHMDLRTAGYKMIGYDLSPQMGHITRSKFNRAGMQAILARGIAQQLPFNDEAFAAIVCTFPTDFIVDPATLRAINRVLKPNGVVVVVLNGELIGSGPWVRFIEWLYRITGQRNQAEVNPAAYFEGYGFKVEAVEEACPNSRVQLVLLRK